MPENYLIQNFTDKEKEELLKLGTVRKEELVAYVLDNNIYLTFGDSFPVKVVPKEGESRNQFVVSRKRVAKFVERYPKEEMSALEGAVLLGEAVLAACAEKYTPGVMMLFTALGNKDYASNFLEVKKREPAEEEAPGEVFPSP